MGKRIEYAIHNADDELIATLWSDPSGRLQDSQLVFEAAVQDLCCIGPDDLVERLMAARYLNSAGEEDQVGDRMFWLCPAKKLRPTEYRNRDFWIKAKRKRFELGWEVTVAQDPPDEQ